MYPEICINKNHLLNNVRVLVNLCSRYNIEITGVTKMFGADPILARIFVDGGIHLLGDSRIQNLRKLKDFNAEKWLIRIPMISEAAQTVRWSDVSLNSELRTIKALQAEAKKQNKVHKIILMVDLGDLREGYTDYNELMETAGEIEKMDSLKLYGVGTNLTCFSFVQPDTGKLSQLEKLSKVIAGEAGKLIISGGNSSTIQLMLNGGIPGGVNNLRLGESLLFGRERAGYRFLENTYSDVFILKTEIVEIKEKPSMPWGTIGVDSYGRRPSFEDRGLRVKAICAIGKYDIDVETMKPLDTGIKILGASSDHLMIDVSDSEHIYKVGDVVDFKMGYFSTMRAFASRYVHKEYI